MKNNANTSRQPLEERIHYLLADLCVEWGFCIPPEDAARIAQSKHLEADQFALEVLQAEGYELGRHSEWFSPIKKRFIDRFGQSASIDDYS